MVNETVRALDRRRALGYISLEVKEKEKVFGELQARKPQLDWSQFVAALETVARLQERAFELGNQVHDGLLTGGKAFRTLRSEFPELARDVIDIAYGNGLYESSK